MILRDRIEIIEAGVSEDDYGNTVVDWDNPRVVEILPAQMDYVSTEVNAGGTSSFRVVEKLVAITRPFTFHESRQRIRWNGGLFRPDGPEKVISAGGRVHHIELPLTRVTG